MPTYDYRCRACGHALEIFHSMSAAAKKKCPACGKPKLERLIGAGAGILFKGGGFYQTDYRSDSYKQAETADKNASAPATEAKPAEGASAPAAESPKPAAKPEPAGGAKPPAKKRG